MIQAVGFVFLFVSIFWMTIHILTDRPGFNDHRLVTASLLAMAVGFIMVQL